MVCSVWTWATCARCDSSSGKNLSFASWKHVCKYVCLHVCVCMYAYAHMGEAHVAMCISSLSGSRGLQLVQLMLAVASLIHRHQRYPT